MARPKKAVEQSTPVKTNPCEGCKYAPHDTKKQACKTCIRNKENG